MPYYRVFRLCFLQCAKKSPAALYFSYSVSPALVINSRCRDRVFKWSMPHWEWFLALCWRRKRLFFMVITMCLFLLGVAENLYLRSISTFSQGLCCQPHRGKVLSSWLGLTSGAKMLAFGHMVWMHPKDHSLVWAQLSPLGMWTVLTRILGTECSTNWKYARQVTIMKKMASKPLSC